MNSWTGRSKDGGREHALRKGLRHRSRKDRKQEVQKGIQSIELRGINQRNSSRIQLFKLREKSLELKIYS